MISYFSLLCLVLTGSEIICYKLIQNNTNYEALVNRIEKLEATVFNMSKTRAVDDPVMFFAIINSRDFNLDTDSIVVFEKVVINEGGHYNSYDGVFVAPRDGIYLFSWTVSSKNANRVFTELVVNEKVISSTGEKGVDANEHMSASMTSLCHMKGDNHAWIRTTGYSGPHHFVSNNNYPRTSFLGLLVHAD